MAQSTLFPAYAPGGGGYAPLSGRLWWRTADGADLTLAVGARPGFGRGAASGRALRPWRVRDRRRTAALERLLRAARRVGTLRSLTTGTRYGVFRGRFGPVAWDVVARPLPGGGGEIVAVRRAGALVPQRLSARRRRRYGLRRELGGAAGQGEMGMLGALAFAPDPSRGVQMGWPRPVPVTPPTPTPPPTPAPAKTVKVTFEWVPGCTLDKVCPNAGKGFYVIYNWKNKPVYAGRTDDFRTRMRQYSQYGRVFERPLADYRVFFAKAKGLGDDLLERYVIRSVITLAGPVQNVEGIEPYVLSKDAIEVTHTGKGGDIPPFLKQDKSRKDKYGKKIEHRWKGGSAITSITAGAEYELPWPAA